MRFEKAELYQFRNIKKAKVDFHPHLNIFIGKNGQGKTNFIEAMHLVSNGDTFRFGKTKDLIFLGTHESSIRTRVRIGENAFNVSTYIYPSKKKTEVDGKALTASHVFNKAATVVFSPESLSAIKEGADVRRHLVDEALVTASPRNRNLIIQFRRALKARNKVLKALATQSPQAGPGAESYRVLESLNPIFFNLATELTYERIQTLKQMLPDIQYAMRYISLQSHVDVSVDYVISDTSAWDFSRETIAQMLHERHAKLALVEAKLGSSLVGPQKHDVRILYNQKDSRIFCSQGQQRALILSFKMAQIVYHKSVYGTYPVLMMDDVLSELDLEKRTSLISFLKELRAQIFVTSTDVTLPAEMGLQDYMVFNVNGGNFYPLSKDIECLDRL
jgi:DNA replication and repair protein RecF